VLTSSPLDIAVIIVSVVISIFQVHNSEKESTHGNHNLQPNIANNITCVLGYGSWLIKIQNYFIRIYRLRKVLLLWSPARDSTFRKCQGNKKNLTIKLSFHSVILPFKRGATRLCQLIREQQLFRLPAVNQSTVESLRGLEVGVSYLDEFSLL